MVNPEAALTRCSAVTALVVTAHPFDLLHNGAGQLLDNVVLATLLWVAFKGVVQSLLLTVLKH